VHFDGDQGSFHAGKCAAVKNSQPHAIFQPC
jgi:hypothetical protein